MSSKLYITTPLYYVNAKPHLGHAYSTLIADVFCRFNNMLDIKTLFVTGTDEHGDKILKVAKKKKIKPQEYVNDMSFLFKKLWEELNISNSKFIRTTNKNHINFVKNILMKLYESGEIYFGKYEGLYCFECERFYSKRELDEGKCPDHNLTPTVIKESNYFLKTSKYQNWLINYLNNNKGFIRPEEYKKEILNLLKYPIEDLCISRPKSRSTWGIELPFDSNYTTYVWFDALLNYVSVIDYPNKSKYTEYWNKVQHIIAKDILKPHAIFWPIILKMLNFPIFKKLNIHGYWKIENKKMSKSIGNTVNPANMKNLYGVDSLRYFLIKEMKFGLDSTFSEKKLITRVNSDLSNDLGNLFSRITSMVNKFDFLLKETPEKEYNSNLENYAIKTMKDYILCMNEFKFHKALSKIWNFISKMNKYIDSTTPWMLAKDNNNIKKLKFVLNELLRGLNLISVLIYPVMPKTSEKMQYCLGLNSGKQFFALKSLKKWSEIKVSNKNKKKISLFPRINS